MTSSQPQALYLYMVLGYYCQEKLLPTSIFVRNASVISAAQCSRFKLLVNETNQVTFFNETVFTNGKNILDLILVKNHYIRT